MDGKRDARWLAVAELAATQHGVVAVWQLLRLGLPRTWLEQQIRSGHFQRVFRGAYAVGHAALTVEGRWLAAVLACGPEAKLSHWAAAAHWGLLSNSVAVIDVVVPRHRRGQKGLQVHHVTLHAGEWTRRDGIPITTVPRTLLDFAAVANHRQLRRATNQAARAGWLNPRVINQLQTRHRGRAGMKAFKTVTAAMNPQTWRTRSELEDDFSPSAAGIRSGRVPFPTRRWKASWSMFISRAPS